MFGPDPETLYLSPMFTDAVAKRYTLWVLDQMYGRSTPAILN